MRPSWPNPWPPCNSYTDLPGQPKVAANHELFSSPAEAQQLIDRLKEPAPGGCVDPSIEINIVDSNTDGAMHLGDDDRRMYALVWDEPNENDAPSRYTVNVAVLAIAIRNADATPNTVNKFTRNPKNGPVNSAENSPTLWPYYDGSVSYV